MSTKRSVCIVGAGAAGLATLRNFLLYRESFGEIVCYEQTKFVGGTWNYVEQTGKDENGLPIHSSMYKNLRTNLPKQIMEYPDFELKSDDCFMPYTEVLKYLNDYCQNFQLAEKIQLETVVRKVVWNDQNANWNVTVESFKHGPESGILTRDFDVVVLCHGHYSTPLYSDVKGLEKFKGQVFHSHDFRTSGQFKDQTVLVIGAGFSGTDIALELTAVSDKVYLLDRKDKPWFTELGAIKLINGSLREFGENSVEIELKNNDEVKELTLENVDTVFVCTGYRLNFDLLDPNCGISVNPDNTVNGFYRHIVNIEHPTMACIGINSFIPPCKLFHAQSHYYVRHLAGKFKLPEPEAMVLWNDDDLKAKLMLGQRPKDRHKFHLEMIEEYFRDLAEDAGMEAILKPVTLKMYRKIQRDMCDIPLGFKRVIYRVLNDNDYVVE